MTKTIFWGCTGLLAAALIIVVAGLLSDGWTVTGRLDDKQQEPTGIAGTGGEFPASGKMSVCLEAFGVGNGADEMPFEFSAQDHGNPSDGNELGTDPVKLCEELREAIVSRDISRISACRTKLLALGEESVSALTSLINCGIQPVEIEALRLLTYIGGPRALAVAIGRVLSLESDDPGLQQYLAVFADCRDPGASEWLADFLGRTEHADMRERILAILKTLRSGDLVLSLAMNMEAPADALHAEDSATALLQCDDPSHAAMLEYLLREADALELRRIAASALANVGSPEAVRFLLVEADEDKDDADIYLAALSSVTSTYGQEELLKAVSDKSLPSPVRQSAVEALSNQMNSRIHTIFQNLGRDEPDAAVASIINISLDNSATTSESDSGTSEAPEAINEELWYR